LSKWRLKNIEVAELDSAKATIGPINAGTLVMVVLGVTAVEIALRIIPWHEMASPLMLLGVFRVIEGAFIVGIALSQKTGLSILGLSTGGVFSGFRRGLLWSAGFGVVALLVFIPLRFMGADPLSFIKIHLPLNTRDMILFFLMGGMVSPLTEELFFRGILYGFLRRWGVGPAVMISALVFALAHGTFTGFFLVLLTGGIMFAVVYEIEKNLAVPMTLHVLGNLALYALSWLNG